MGAILNDSLRALFRTFATQVSHTLFRYYDVHGVFAMVVVRYHRHNGTDLSFFGYRRASENGDVSVSSEISRSSDAVHHLSSTNMGRIYIAIQIHFDGGVDRNHTQAAD